MQSQKGGHMSDFSGFEKVGHVSTFLRDTILAEHNRPATNYLRCILRFSLGLIPLAPRHYYRIYTPMPYAVR